MPDRFEGLQRERDNRTARLAVDCDDQSDAASIPFIVGAVEAFAHEPLALADVALRLLGSAIVSPRGTGGKIDSVQRHRSLRRDARAFQGPRFQVSMDAFGCIAPVAN